MLNLNALSVCICVSRCLFSRHEYVCVCKLFSKVFQLVRSTPRHADELPIIKNTETQVIYFTCIRLNFIDLMFVILSEHSINLESKTHFQND